MVIVPFSVAILVQFTIFSNCYKHKLKHEDEYLVNLVVALESILFIVEFDIVVLVMSVVVDQFGVGYGVSI